MARTPKDDTELAQAEADRKRDEALKRALNMPPKPHKPAGKKKPTKRRKHSSKPNQK